MKKSTPLWVAALLLASACCSTSQIKKPAGLPVPIPTALTPAAVSVYGLDLAPYVGLSGVATNEAGTLIAVPERMSFLLSIDIENDTPALVGEALTLPDPPQGLDLESLTFLPDGSFAIGTESRVPNRAVDLILRYQFEGEIIQALPPLEMPYKLWDIRGENNKGIEGLCSTQSHLVAGVELAIEADGGRFAPIGIYNQKTKAWAAYRLWLTSEEGKISSLDCWEEDGVIKVLALERHFEVSRILNFDVPTAKPEIPDQTLDIVPTVFADLSKAQEEIPNLEGIIRQKDGTLVLMSDNAYGSNVSGPTYFWVLDVNNLPR